MIRSTATSCCIDTIHRNIVLHWYDPPQHRAALTRVCVWHDGHSFAVDSVVSVWQESDCCRERLEIGAISTWHSTHWHFHSTWRSKHGSLMWRCDLRSSYTLCQLASQLVTVVVDNRYRQISAVVLLVSAITHPEFEKKEEEIFCCWVICNDWVFQIKQTFLYAAQVNEFPQTSNYWGMWIGVYRNWWNYDYGHQGRHFGGLFHLSTVQYFSFSANVFQILNTRRQHQWP